VEDSGVLKLAGIIIDFSIWDDAIHLFAVKFYNQYNVYPNILLANKSTYGKLIFMHKCTQTELGFLMMTVVLKLWKQVMSRTMG
jgi:hypothetical protein